MTIKLGWRHNGTIACDDSMTFDLSAAPLIIEDAYNNTFRVDLAALPVANDTVSYFIAGWEED